MSTLKKLMSFVKIFAICAVLMLAFFSPVAMAETGSGFVRRLYIQGENFQYKQSQPLYSEREIKSVVVSLKPANETGTIEKILITGPDGETEFSCANQKIENGVDLVKSCGAEAPLHLEAGETTYMAMGSGFSPNASTLLEVQFK
ncbi:MAG: hypothetical protein ACFCUV_03970 [Rivularia sp. (in: cyanobacteria)]